MKKAPKPKSSQTKKTQPTPSINSVGHVYITGADKDGGSVLYTFARQNHRPHDSTQYIGYFTFNSAIC